MTKNKSKNNLNKLINNLSSEELWESYSLIETKLREKELIRSHNIVGDRGEFIAINFYNKNSNLPKLQFAPEGTKNVDALSRDGDRYSIKTFTVPSTTTGAFHGMGNPEDIDIPEKKFEYLIMVQIDKNYMPKLILELTWNQFVKFRRWHKTMRAWNISLTKLVYSESKVMFNSRNV